MSGGLLAQRLAALFLAGCLAFNFPLLGIWDGDANVFGVPVFLAALFLLWLALIAVLAWWMERAASEPDD
jgi:cation transporter-like permease